MIQKTSINTVAWAIKFSNILNQDCAPKKGCGRIKNIDQLYLAMQKEVEKYNTKLPIEERLTVPWSKTKRNTLLYKDPKNAVRIEIGNAVVYIDVNHNKFVEGMEPFFSIMIDKGDIKMFGVAHKAQYFVENVPESLEYIHKNIVPAFGHEIFFEMVDEWTAKVICEQALIYWEKKMKEIDSDKNVLLSLESSREKMVEEAEDRVCFYLEKIGAFREAF